MKYSKHSEKHPLLRFNKEFLRVSLYCFKFSFISQKEKKKKIKYTGNGVMANLGSKM